MKETSSTFLTKLTNAFGTSSGDNMDDDAESSSDKIDNNEAHEVSILSVLRHVNLVYVGTMCSL